MLRRYERLQETNSWLGDALIRGNALASNMGMLFSQIMIVSVVFAGSWFVINGKMTPGGLSACMMLSVRALQPLRRGLSVWMRYQSFVAALDRLNQVFAMPYEQDEAEAGNAAANQEPGIGAMSPCSLRVLIPERQDHWPEVRFMAALTAICMQDEFFPISRWRMEFFSSIPLKLAAGQTIAILGVSGSGKSQPAVVDERHVAAQFRRVLGGWSAVAQFCQWQCVQANSPVAANQHDCVWPPS